MVDDPAELNLKSSDLSPPPAPQAKYARHGLGRGDARDLVLLWCLWLLGSWLVSSRIDGVYSATRWMVFAGIVGLMVMWPALRLGQDRQRISRPTQVLWDWWCLNLVVQTVIWPLQLSARWSLEQTLWIDASMASWSLLTGAVLAWAGGVWTPRRDGLFSGAAMAVCMLLLMGEPLLLASLAWLDLQVTWRMWLSPIDVLWDLTSQPPVVHRERILAVAALALACWLPLAWRRCRQ